MADPMSDYVADPTRHWFGVYDTGWGVMVTAFGAVMTIISTISMLVNFFEGNPINAATLALLIIIGIYLFKPMFHCSEHNVRQKREVYIEYNMMSRKDREKYKNIVRTIQRECVPRAFNYDDVLMLFKNKSVSNENSVEAMRQVVDNDVAELKRLKKELKDKRKLEEDILKNELNG